VPSKVDRLTTTSFARVPSSGVVVIITHTSTEFPSITLPSIGIAKEATIIYVTIESIYIVKTDNKPSSSVRVTRVALFPRLKLIPEVTRESTAAKSSSDSTRLSGRIITDVHISAPSPEPGENVKCIFSAAKSSFQILAANTIGNAPHLFPVCGSIQEFGLVGIEALSRDLFGTALYIIGRV
jgi:hypothetical protein